MIIIGKVDLKWLVVVAVVFWVAGYLIGAHGGQSAGPFIKQVREYSAQNNKYKFINPLLFCQENTDVQISQYGRLKSEIERVIDKHLGDGSLSTASVYFDTRNGSWLAVNPEKKYDPASLTKLPLLIAVLKEAESDPSLLTRRLKYSPSVDYNQGEHYKSAKTLVAGQSYSVDELLRYLIVFSDNNAIDLLESMVSPTDLTDVYGYLRAPLPVDDADPDFMGVRDYANFFRVLFNASYLTRDMSEKAMALLAETEFMGGLRSALPPGIVVSEKFGERFIVGDLGESKQLHSCGVIYFPETPYLLCVMTKGRDFEQLSSVIKEVSSAVYHEVESHLSRL